MIWTRHRQGLGILMVSLASPALIWGSPPQIAPLAQPHFKAAGRDVAPRGKMSPGGRPFVGMNVRSVIEPDDIDPGFVVPKSNDIDMKFVIVKPAEIDAGIIAIRPGDSKRR